MSERDAEAKYELLERARLNTLDAAEAASQESYDECPHHYSEVLSGVKCIRCGHFIGNWE